MLAAALSLPGCLGSGDGNPPRGSISAPRGPEGARRGGTEAGEDFQGAKTRTKAGSGNRAEKPGGL
jgi:hypothetical protein